MLQARQPSFFPQDFPGASPSHSPFFPPPPPSPSAASAAPPQPKGLFGGGQLAPSAQPLTAQPANHFLQQIGIPDNLQQFILSPPKQDFPLPNVQQVSGPFFANSPRRDFTPELPGRASTVPADLALHSMQPTRKGLASWRFDRRG